MNRINTLKYLVSRLEELKMQQSIFDELHKKMVDAAEGESVWNYEVTRKYDVKPPSKLSIQETAKMIRRVSLEIERDEE